MEERRTTRAREAAPFNPEALCSPRAAIERYFASAELRAPTVESTSLAAAFARVLAQDVRSDADHPAEARSTMDGFAVRARETPGSFEIASDVRMGQDYGAELRSKAAAPIPTGGVLPPGADAVAPIEQAKTSDGKVRIETELAAGDCVNPRGADMRAGELLLERGRILGPAELGVLATLGLTTIATYRVPVFAVISSGDELVEVSQTPQREQIRDSNRWAIAGLLQALGARIYHAPIVRDDPKELERALHDAVRDTDGVVLTGGSSVGERDFTPEVIDRLGEPGVIVHGLRVKPGKPTVLACVDGKPVIGLPGNPTSALIILQTVAAPIIAAATGAKVESAKRDAKLCGTL